MKLLRLLKIFTVPLKLLKAQLYPVSYAEKIGVVMNGKVTIYGSSYKMFSSEPCLERLENIKFIKIISEYLAKIEMIYRAIVFFLKKISQ